MTSPDTVEFRGDKSLRLVADEWNRDAGGDQPTILMLHGGGQNRFSWKNTGQILAGRGFHVIALDARGHGDSDRAPDAQYTIHALARDVSAVLARLERPVVIVGALDTKGEEYRFVRNLIQARGLETIVVDFGVLGDPPFEPEIGNDAVARAGGGDIAVLRASKDKAEAMRVMSSGLARIVRDLYEAGRLGGVLGMAGSGGTSIATAAMRELPPAA